MGNTADKSFVVNKGNLKEVNSVIKLKFLLLENKAVVQLIKGELTNAILVLHRNIKS